MTRVEINGSQVPSQHCPPRVTLVYPEPEAYTLTGVPIYEGYPTAILAWDEGATAATLNYWTGQAGRVTGIMLPDPRYGGDVVRSGTTYKYHNEWGYGVVRVPTSDEGASVEGATLYAPSASAVIAEFGAAEVRIEMLGRYPSWPY